MGTAGLFHVEPSSGVPIYRQLVDQVRALRASGRLKAGDFIPSVRQLAEALAVNPMTVSKAWSQIEREGMVEFVRGHGMRVLAPDATGTQTQRMAELMPMLEQVASRAHQLSLPRTTVLNALDKLIEENQA